MLPRKHRLVDAEDFSHTLKTGAKTGNRFLVVTIAVPSPGAAFVLPETANEPRLGLVIAKRQLPRAVDRNLLKRRLRHIMADKINSLPAGATVVIRGFAPSLGLDYPELDDLVTRSLAKTLRKLPPPSPVSSDQ